MNQEEMQKLAERRALAVAQGVSNANSYFAHKAQGAEVWSLDGKRYLDFAGGIGVMNVGHSNPKVVAAIQEQAARFTHVCFNVLMYEGYVELAEKLNRLTPGDFPKKTMFVNSGAETVENAVKVARSYTKRPGVIVFDDAFHGRTLLTMTMTSKVKPYKFGFGPFAPEVYRIPFAYCYRCAYGLSYPSCGVACAHALEDFFLKQVAAENTACIVAEPVQGEGGFIVPPKEYFAILRRICDKHGIVLVADEVQTGVCRTGKLYAMEHFGVAADLMTTAKSLGAGLPLGALVGRAEMMDAPQVGGLGGTYGGNPVSCAAALAVLEFVEENDLCAQAARVGQMARERFEAMAQKYPLIGEVRGLGAMLALELVRDPKTKEPAGEETKKLVDYCHQSGLLALNCGRYGNIIRTLMPLVISDAQLEEGLVIIEKGLALISK